MKYQDFEGSNKENRDFADIFNVKDNSRGISIVLGVSIGLYILAMIAFGYISDTLKHLVKTIMIICTLGVPIVYNLKYKKKGGTFSSFPVSC